MQPVSWQRIGKHVPMETNMNATIVTLGNSESQGAWRQEELICGKPPVIK
jgi:hypothetical protein